MTAGTGKVMVMTSIGGEMGDEMFSNDLGTWNVSLAYRDCAAGLHPILSLEVGPCYAANKRVQVDEAKIEKLLKGPLPTAPLLGVMENGALYLIDGHHRLRAKLRKGIKYFPAYVIADGTPYQVLFNGARRPPYKMF